MIQLTSDKTRTEQASQTDREWAVIMAGGDGNRLRSLTRRIAGVKGRSNSAPCSAVRRYWKKLEDGPL